MSVFSGLLTADQMTSNVSDFNKKKEQDNIKSFDESVEKVIGAIINILKNCSKNCSYTEVEGVATLHEFLYETEPEPVLKDSILEKMIIEKRSKIYNTAVNKINEYQEASNRANKCKPPVYKYKISQEVLKFYLVLEKRVEDKKQDESEQEQSPYSATSPAHDLVRMRFQHPATHVNWWACDAENQF